MIHLAQTSSGGGAAGAFMVLIFGFWCLGISMGVGQLVLFIIALVQILSRAMPTDAKLLWCLVSWLVPILGPILWWTIGSKQHPEAGGGGGVRRDDEQNAVSSGMQRRQP